MFEDIEENTKWLLRFLQMYSSIQEHLKSPFQKAVETQIANTMVRVVEGSISSTFQTTQAQTNQVQTTQAQMGQTQTTNTETGYQGNDANKDAHKDGETPIYQKITPGEVLIISKNEDGFLVAENKDGSINTRRVRFNEIG